MAEYWKSTPKYWCKFCEIYIRDTKLERQQHEATGKHKGSVQRSLRNIHRTNEQAERETQRAKAEVARLNGLGAGGSGGASKDAPWKKADTSGAPQPPKTATVEDRKKQMQQLADMGVAIPEQYRREMAMAGEWQVERVIERPRSSIKKEEDVDVKPDGLAVGVRKRKHDEDEEAMEGTAALDANKQQTWGRRFKTFPGKNGGDEDDIEALLGAAKKAPVKSEEDDGDGQPEIKKEEATEDSVATAVLPEVVDSNTVAKSSAVKAELEEPAGGVIFKKRKKKIAVPE